MSRIPNSRNYRTTSAGNASAQHFSHPEFAGRESSDSSSNRTSASTGSAKLILWSALALAAWLLLTHPLVTIGTLICIVVAWALFAQK
jgi:hypothetical protein